MVGDVPDPLAVGLAHLIRERAAVFGDVDRRVVREPVPQPGQGFVQPRRLDRPVQSGTDESRRRLGHDPDVEGSVRKGTFYNTLR